MSIRELQKELFKTYKDKGYLEEWTSKNNSVNEQKKIDIAELGLVCTEIAEAMELLRQHKYKREDLAEECADIIIRTINFMSKKGLDLDIALWLKNNKNKKRECLHGKAV